MSDREQSQAACVSDDTFTAQMWRLEERGQSKAAAEVRQQWRHAQRSKGYCNSVGALTSHEIDAFAAKYLASTSGEDARGFGRAVERAALIKAMTLLPELRENVDHQKNGLTFQRGVAYGFAAYSGAVRALAMGQAQDEAEEPEAVEPRRRDETAKLQQSVGADAVRPRFEAWAGPKQFDLRQRNGDYTNTVTAYAWMGWLGANLNKEAGNGEG